ncbi:hypothetical protein DWU98_15655 [Dyella monticola]|uniref:Lipoprotein n=1 Tax=Dyella monticola TaxID=1927958 RepID=A0A370WV39_9GAMM|nr:Sbal_3080 family lipoprotein [Dyella monticola]RDS79877.1 hypothetical protein DWU98_15655 [Dyella monticola]
MLKMLIRLAGTSTVVLLCACASPPLKPKGSNEVMKRVCIHTNPDVRVDDFVAVMQDGFKRHGVASHVYDTPPDTCNFIVDYTAERSWDHHPPYLSHAEIRITEHGQLIASAVYKVNPFMFPRIDQWSGTKAKIDPLMDQLFVGFHH